MEVSIRIKGKLVIERISRESGNVVERREVDNVLLQRGAEQIALLAYEAPDDVCSVGMRTYRANKLVLLNDRKGLVKEIPDGSFSVNNTGSAIVITITWSDSSSDAYSVYYAGIFRAGVSAPSQVEPNTTLLHASAVSPPFSKSSTDTVRYTWQVTIPYSVI